MEKLIVIVLVGIVLWLVLPELLFPSEAQPRETLFVCGQAMPEFVLDAKGVRLASEREAMHYLTTQQFNNETSVGQLHHNLTQLRWRGVQYRIWTEGGERINSVKDVLAEIQRRIISSWRDEPQAKPTIVGVAYGSVYAEYWLDPTTHQARLAQYLVTLYTNPCS